MKVSVDQTIQRAKTHAKNGEVEQARELYQRILKTFPKNKRAQHALAKIKKAKVVVTHREQDPKPEQIKSLAALLVNGQPQEALSATKSLLKRYPNSSPLWDILGGAHKASGDLPEAETAFRKASQLNPNSSQIFNNFGTALKTNDKTEEAVSAFKSAISIKPDYIEAHLNLGNTLIEAKNYKAAVSSFEEAVALNPEDINLKYGLANAHKEKRDFQSAASVYEGILESQPDHLDALCGLADALREQGELDRAISTYETALTLKPDYANAHFNLASALKERGEIDNAVSSYQKALEIRPNFPACYAEATALKGFPIDEALKDHLLQLSRNKNLSIHEQRHISYAIYNVCNRLKDYETAFKWIVKGAEARRQELDYSIRDDHKEFQQIYDKAPEYMRNYQFTHKSDTRPIFIVGMPRSGTTLTEQIISSHSTVFGAGELAKFPKLTMPLVREKEFSNNHVLRLRVKYLEYIEEISDKSPVVTDKMPHNFRLLPMICAALPEAKIIHIYRSPQATCWSNFTSNFRSPKLGYSFNLDTVVEYYGLYLKLMGEWSKALGDRLYHLSYEALINDQENQTRELLEYADLDWEEQVLSPHKNEKKVRTASAEQVRQPIYKNSSEKWMIYESYLSEAFKTLEGFKVPA